jgi:hypothetical protein
MRGWRLMFWGAVAAVLLWLMRTPAPPSPLYSIQSPQPPAADLGTAFDPGRCGTARGRITWAGPVPAVEPIAVSRLFAPPASHEGVPNPNAPRVSAGGLADAVVWLRGVDLKRSKPWSLQAIAVEVSRAGLVVKQGDQSGRIGLVRRGESVELVSKEAIDPVTRQPAVHSVRARGAAFFTQMLPQPDMPVRRMLPEEGIVELSSGSAYYWLRAYLVASDHPYVAVTGPDGSFELDQVPDGDYELVTWKANWHVERLEHDPEAPFAPARLVFRAAVEKRARVRVVAGQPTSASITFAADEFTSPQ